MRKLKKPDLKPDEFLAHLKPNGDKHLLKHHLKNTSKFAGKFSSKFGEQLYGIIAGLLHDIGKIRGTFGNKLLSACEFYSFFDYDPFDATGHHIGPGVEFTRDYNPIISMIIQGHHGGLHNKSDWSMPIVDDINLLNYIKPKLKILFPVIEDEKIFFNLLQNPKCIRPNNKLDIEVFTRMLFSCLCDADFLDTESFYDSIKTDTRNLYKDNLQNLYDKLENYVTSIEKNGHINDLRKDIKNNCINSAKLTPGNFTLTVPTGGGKTLSGLLFALKHAVTYNKDRVIIVVPYQSITDQTANIYKKIFGTDYVIEHQSSFEQSKLNKNEAAYYELVCENWDAPIIVTTTVQFFESLFANSTSKCRKLHNIANSVVIIDEAQTMPINMLEPILSMIDCLTVNYKTSIIFSTATQPAFNKTDSFKFGLENVREIIPNYEDIFNKMGNRVDIKVDIANITPYTKLAEKISNENSSLTIVPLRNDAKILCEEIDKLLGNRNTYHLSALMCSSHRTLVINDIKEKLKKGELIRLVSTQLIEAGVDIDFPKVNKALSGLDSIAQAAGRCNREGKLDIGNVFVFKSESEMFPKSTLKISSEIAYRILKNKTNINLNDAALFSNYFKTYYFVENTDKKDINEYRRNLEFEEVSKKAKIIDEYSEAVIVPYENSIELINEYGKAIKYSDKKIITRKLQRYSVNITKKKLEDKIGEGIVYEKYDLKYITNTNFYDLRFGLIL